MHRRINAIKNENRMLIQKIEDIRIIDRAKCILISHLSLSEPDAHRYIEKQAMDMRQTRRKVAEEILKTYEN
jgi:response regulator NasT